MNNPKTAILEAINIRRAYRQEAHVLEVLKGVTFSVSEGELLSIVGPSGAGKSTLLHIIGGLDVPNAGNVFFRQTDIYKLNDPQRAKLRNEEIGFVFQFYHLLPEFTALENVLLPVFVRARKAKLKEMEKAGRAMLELVGLGARVSHKPHQLSGGEQQRVAIARALINEPALLLCDEPTGNLDWHSGQEIINLLLSLNRTHRQTLVIVTHDENIARLSNRIVHMRDGVFVG